MIFNRGLIQSEYPAGTRFVKGDRNKGFNLKERFDAVIDMCAYSGAQTENTLRELRFDFFLHFSTAAVYWPIRNDYIKGKVECERFLEKSGIKYAALRPVYILGPKNYLPRESFIYNKIKNREPIILPGNGRAKVQFVFAEEVAEAIVAITEKRAAGAFNCAGDETITLINLVKTMGKIMGKEPILRFNPSADEENFNETEFPFANENMVCDNGKIKKLGLKFRLLISGLKEDYENCYQNII